ncbi:MAG: hypothetical protein D6693_09605, partial [Planctomycetota bacterium]
MPPRITNRDNQPDAPSPDVGAATIVLRTAAVVFVVDAIALPVAFALFPGGAGLAGDAAVSAVVACVT